MKLKEAPVYWDLLKLPLPVLVRRLKNRLFGSEKVKVKKPFTADLPMLNFLTFSNFSAAEGSEKWEILLNHYLNDEFNYLGSGWVSIRNDYRPSGFEGHRYGETDRPELSKEEIDWNRDQRTGFQFAIPGNPSEELQKAFATEGVDVKFSWEFARLHHLPQLGVISRLFPEKDKELRVLFQKHVKSFTEQNPYGKSIHWSSAMEVSVRLVNLLVGYNLLFNKVEEFGEVIKKVAYEHMHFIYHHLEHKNGIGTNHYLSNLMGLVVGGFYFGKDPDAKSWQQFALVEFEKELQKQFFPDGGNFEFSTYYHRLSTEIVLITYFFGSASGYGFSQKSKDILAKALKFLISVKKPDKRLPMFGDNDSGRILDLDPEGEMLGGEFIPQPEKTEFIQQVNDQTGVYGWFYEQLNSDFHLPDVKMPTSSFQIDNYEFPKGAKSWEIQFSKIDLEKIRKYVYPDTGIYILRSPEFYLAVNLMANPEGHRYRGHMHNDKGSFELQVHHEVLSGDPGMYSYTASRTMRNRYRSTRAHNIPWAGIEQNRYLPGLLGLFHSRLDVKTKVLEFSEKTLLCEIRYRGVIHYRGFNIFEDHLKISDWCNRKFTIKKDQNIPATSGYGKLL